MGASKDAVTGAYGEADDTYDWRQSVYVQLVFQMTVTTRVARLTLTQSLDLYAQ